MFDLTRLADDAGRLIAQFRRENVPIHCIANSADEGFTTRVLDAVGSIVTTTHDPRELATMIDDCSALMIQMGPTNDMRESGIASAVEHAQKSRKPWVLDTLLAHRSPFRTEFLRSQLAHRPTIVRAAPEDITATLIKRNASPIDFAKRFNTVAICCRSDIGIHDGMRSLVLPYGASGFQNIRMLGSARSAICAAMSVLEPDAFKAAAAALAITETASSVAAKAAGGPGSFSIFFLDALSFIDAQAISTYLSACSAESDAAAQVAETN